VQTRRSGEPFPNRIRQHSDRIHLRWRLAGDIEHGVFHSDSRGVHAPRHALRQLCTSVYDNARAFGGVRLAVDGDVNRRARPS
jgi:hypothetical protein